MTRTVAEQNGAPILIAFGPSDYIKTASRTSQDLVRLPSSLGFFFKLLK